MGHDNTAESAQQSQTVESRLITLSPREDVAVVFDEDWKVDETELASCYVIHIATRSRGNNPHDDDGTRYNPRFGRLVLSTKDEVRQWMELEFGTLKSLMLYLASGQDILLQVVHGISENINVATDHSELLLSRIHLTLCDIPIHFRNVRLRTTRDRNQYETEGWMPTPRRQVIDGTLFYAQEMMGVDSYYEIYVRSDAATTTTAIAGQHPRQCCICRKTLASHHCTPAALDHSTSSSEKAPCCGPALFDCSKFRQELRDWHTTPPNASSADAEIATTAPLATLSTQPRLNDGRILWECIAFDQDVPDLPSRPLRHGETLVFYDSDDDSCDEIRLGWTSYANSNQTIVDWKTFFYPPHD
jgi:hypothetical protein